jgi:hypothetical protein
VCLDVEQGYCAVAGIQLIATLPQDMSIAQHSGQGSI